MSIYDPLRHALVASHAPSFRMSIPEIEKLIGRSLPRSAYVHDAWWSNEDPATTTHSQSRAWTRAGYDAEVNWSDRAVTFRRRKSKSHTS
jgi:hypothetical protein